MSKVKILFMDVDGTLTDGKLYIGANGELFKAFDVKDGAGIHDILPKYNIIPVIITARNSEILKYRCKELCIDHLYQGSREKKKKMIEISQNFGLTINDKGIIENTAYIGDDILDIPCLEIAQYKGCPHDAISDIKDICNFVSKYNGGNGAVREFIEWLINL